MGKKNKPQKDEELINGVGSDTISNSKQKMKDNKRKNLEYLLNSH